jgi:hypothetical protein
MSSRSRSTVASACCATPSSPRADSGDKHVRHPAAPPGRPVGARRCRGADTCAGRRRGPGQGRHNRRQHTGSVGAQGYLCLDAPLPAIPGIELNGTVIDRGRDVTEPAPSQAVFVSARDLRVRAGCYAEYIAVPAQACTLCRRDANSKPPPAYPTIRLPITRSILRRAGSPQSASSSAPGQAWSAVLQSSTR